MAKWPNGADLDEWIGGPSSPARTALREDIVQAAIEVAWGDLDPAKMPAQDLPEEDRCPASIRMAVLILAAKVDTRRQSTNGVIASGELFFRVSREDPDYRTLIARYAVSADA